MGLLDVPGMTPIAKAFGPTEVGLTVAALEGAGFRVFVPGYNTLSNVQFLSIGFGGVPIMVEIDRAAEAWDFLKALEMTHIRLVNDIPAQTSPNDLK